jgi:hypothetical protein
VGDRREDDACFIVRDKNRVLVYLLRGRAGATYCGEPIDTVDLITSDHRGREIEHCARKQIIRARYRRRRDRYLPPRFLLAKEITERLSPRPTRAF